MAARKVDERHEIVVAGEHATFVFVADSRQGKLVIRKEEEDGGSEVCSLTLSDSHELADFFEGLRRVLATPGLRAQLPRDVIDEVPAPSVPPPQQQLAPKPARRERDEAIERARQRNPNAFAPWTREEEEALKQRHARGATFADMARAHNRSVHAIKMRLLRLGLVGEDEV